MRARPALLLVLMLTAATSVTALDGVLARGAGGGSGDVVVRGDLRYGTAGGKPLLLDAYLPSEYGRARPAIIFVHGGGWRAGDKSAFAPGEQPFAPTASHLVRLGWVTLSIDYRLVPAARFPAAPSDVIRAVRWVRKHARELGVDPARLALFGASAGGNLAALAATEGSGRLDIGSRVRAAVSWSGPMDLALFDRELRPASRRPFVEDYLGCSLRACPDLYRRASPTSHVDRSDPPLLIVNGSREIVPLAQAQEMTRALADAGVPHGLLVVPGGRHAAEYEAAALEPTVRFLRRHLRR